MTVPADLGRALRRQRQLQGLKQSHVAELLQVTQGTVSRWERGSHRPTRDQVRRLTHFLQAASDNNSDNALKRLVETSLLAVHLVCDTSHRLLASSPARRKEWRCDADLRGTSLWRFATEEIRAAEARLVELGWYEPAPRPVMTWTGRREGPPIAIESGTMLWERTTLSDGRLARLVTSLPRDMESAAARLDACTAVPAPVE